MKKSFRPEYDCIDGLSLGLFYPAYDIRLKDLDSKAGVEISKDAVQYERNICVILPPKTSIN